VASSNRDLRAEVCCCIILDRLSSVTVSPWQSSIPQAELSEKALFNEAIVPADLRMNRTARCSPILVVKATAALSLSTDRREHLTMPIIFSASYATSRRDASRTPYSPKSLLREFSSSLKSISLGGATSEASRKARYRRDCLFILVISLFRLHLKRIFALVSQGSFELERKEC